MDKINAGVPFSCKRLRLRRVGFGRWISALPSWGLSLDPALMVGRLSFLKKKKKGRKRVSAWWGGSVGFDVACGRGWEVRWLRTAPPYAL